MKRSIDKTQRKLIAYEYVALGHSAIPLSPEITPGIVNVAVDVSLLFMGTSWYQAPCNPSTLLYDMDATHWYDSSFPYALMRYYQLNTTLTQLNHPLGWSTSSPFASPSLCFRRFSNISFTPSMSPTLAFPAAQSTTMGHLNVLGFFFANPTISEMLGVSDTVEGCADKNNEGELFGKKDEIVRN